MLRISCVTFNSGDSETPKNISQIILLGFSRGQFSSGVLNSMGWILKNIRFYHCNHCYASGILPTLPKL